MIGAEEWKTLVNRWSRNSKSILPAVCHDCRQTLLVPRYSSGQTGGHIFKVRSQVSGLLPNKRKGKPPPSLGLFGVDAVTIQLPEGRAKRPASPLVAGLFGVDYQEHYHYLREQSILARISLAPSSTSFDPSGYTELKRFFRSGARGR